MAKFSSCKWRYDVFLSFRGEDTRTRFTDHLYEALKGKGIFIFRDENELEEGMDISSELKMAIEASRTAIVVLSKNYASSTWCLEELVKIFECKEEMGMSVLPVFYDVEPSNVRKQRGSFAEAFVKHEAVFGVDSFKVGRWRQVLTQVANLKGWSSHSWPHESKMIEEISQAIWKKIQLTLTVHEEDQLVGISSKLKLLAPLLDAKNSDDHMVLVGIHGMGGIGKTTIARVAYERIRDEFDVHCFLSDVREIFQTSGLPYLQKKLLSRILLMKKIDIWDAQEGLVTIKRVISDKKVLLVLDDVDQLDQINGLIPNQTSFGFGSRIIITTRNADLLLTFGVERMFKMEELVYEEALQLLSLSSFKENYPKEGFLGPSNSIVKLLGGHPLALKVLGTTLRNKGLSVWNNTIEELQEGVHHDQVFKSLQISYDGLDEKEKEIFLDIACFFKGKKRDRVVEILDGCGFFAKIRVDLLIQKSLITISSDDKLQMHDLLQEMGRQIVRQKSIQNRLWCRKDIKNVVTEAIQSIFLKLTKKVDISILFSRMHKLRLLNFHNVGFQNHSEYCIPSELRYLKWKRYPLELLNLSFEEYELIELHMCYSNLKQFWKVEKDMEKLKYIKFSHSQKLFKTPNFTKIPNLESLDLEGCTSLVNIHPSIFTAKRLILLNLKDCTNLTSLPSHIQIESLSILILSGCSKIMKIPEFTGNTERLLELHLDKTSIRKLPLSIGSLNGLKLLTLKNCDKLISIPSSIQMLKSLQSLDLSGCSKLGDQQKKLDDIECMEELDIRGTARIRRKKEDKPLSTVIVERFRGMIPHFYKTASNGVLGIPSLYGLYSLTALILSDCNLGVIPEGIDSVSSLRELVLSGNKFSHLPESISRLENLRVLNVNQCKKLLCFPDQLPSRLRMLTSKDCVSIKNVPNISKVDHSYFLQHVNLLNCYQLAGNEDLHRLLTSWMQKMYFRKGAFNIMIPGSEIPDWFTTTRIGSSITIKWDPYAPNASNLIRFALCSVCGPIPTDPQNIATLPFRIIASVTIRNSGNDNQDGDFCGGFSVSETIKLDHVWMFVLPHSTLRNKLRKCREIEFRFDLLVSYRHSVPLNIQVKKCGIRLITMVEEEREAMKQYCSYIILKNKMRLSKKY